MNSEPIQNAASKSGLFTPTNPTPKTAPQKRPKSTHLKKPKELPKEPSPENTLAIDSLDLSKKEDVYALLKSAKTASLLWNVATKIAERFNRYAETLDAAKTRARGKDEELTVEEMIDRVTAALRDLRATPTDVNALLKAMREINPGMFTSIEGVPPDPCAIAETITGWAGMSGADIVKQLGGAEKMQNQLSETLKVRVTLHV